MYYLIHREQCHVKYKSENSEDLERYLNENELSSEFTIVSSADELYMSFCPKELKLIANDFHKKELPEDDFELAELCWRLMNDLYPQLITTLTQGNKKIENKCPSIFDNPAESKGIDFEKRRRQYNNAPDFINPPKTTIPEPKKRKRKRKFPNSTVLTLGVKPKENTVLFEIYNMVDDNFGSCTIENIIMDCVMDEEKCRRVIMRCISEGNLLVGSNDEI